MNFQRLKYFLTLAKTRSFTQAAQELYVSQPALSKQIKLLESEVGVKLLDRTTRSVQLTFAGRILVVEGEKLIEQEQAMLHRLHIAGGVENAKLTVGTMTSWVEAALPKVFWAFQEENPNVDFTMQRNNCSILFQKLDDRLLDLAFIRVFDPKELQKYNYKQIHISRVAVLVNREHRFASMQEVPIPALRGEPILMMRQRLGNTTFHNDLAQVCFRYSFKPNIVQEYDIVESIYFMVRSGRYISLLSDDLASTLDPDLVMIPLESAPRLYLMAVWTGDNRNPYLPELVSMLPASDSTLDDWPQG